MLRKLREKKIAKKVWIVLAIVVVPAFILWGSSSLIRNREEPSSMGKIFGKTVSFSEYRDALQAVRTQALLQFQDKLPEVEKYLNLEAQALNRIMLLRESQKRRFTASDKEVIQAIEGMSFFQKNSVFNNRIYLEILRYVLRLKPRDFEEIVRQDVLLGKLFQEVSKNITLSEQEIQTEYQKANQEISLYYIASLAADFAKELSPGEEKLKDYFAQNPLGFKQPLSFNLEYILLPAADKDDPQIQEKIKRISARLGRKESFPDIAKEAGLTVKETGLFAENGPLPGIGWLPELFNILSKTKPGDYLQPVYLEKNFYFLRLKEKKGPYLPEFEGIKDKVRSAFIKDESLALAKGKAQECLEKIKQAAQADPKTVDLDKSAKECGLKSGLTANFKFGSYIEGIGASDTFWETALALPEEGISDIIPTPAGFYMVKVKSRTAFDEKKFAAEKSEFSKGLLEQKKQEAFSKFSAQLQQKSKRF